MRVSKPICEDQRDHDRGKSRGRQVRSVDSFERDVQERDIIQVRRQQRHKQRHMFQSAELPNIIA